MTPSVVDLLKEKLTHGELASEELEKEGVEISGYGGFFWTTRVDSVQIGSPGAPRIEDCDKFQKALGIACHNDVLVALFFPLQEDGEEPPHVPTVFNGRGVCSYFRPAWREDCWGEAVNLGTLESGAPEAVKLNISWKADFPSPRELCQLPNTSYALDAAQWKMLLSRSQAALDGFMTGSRECCP